MAADAGVPTPGAMARAAVAVGGAVAAAGVPMVRAAVDATTAAPARSG
ncbi:hypothetical protein ACFV1V_34395 [Streptomyces globisporus]|nr:hypothetical protein [Streptomyces albovinaceus]